MLPRARQVFSSFSLISVTFAQLRQIAKISSAAASFAACYSSYASLYAFYITLLPDHSYTLFYRYPCSLLSYLVLELNYFRLLDRYLFLGHTSQHIINLRPPTLTLSASLFLFTRAGIISYCSFPAAHRLQTTSQPSSPVSSRTWT